MTIDRRVVILHGSRVLKICFRHRKSVRRYPITRSDYFEKRANILIYILCVNLKLFLRWPKVDYVSIINEKTFYLFFVIIKRYSYPPDRSFMVSIFCVNDSLQMKLHWSYGVVFCRRFYISRQRRKNNKRWIFKETGLIGKLLTYISNEQTASLSLSWQLLLRW